MMKEQIGEYKALLATWEWVGRETDFTYSFTYSFNANGTYNYDYVEICDNYDERDEDNVSGKFTYEENTHKLTIYKDNLIEDEFFVVSVNATTLKLLDWYFYSYGDYTDDDIEVYTKK